MFSDNLRSIRKERGYTQEELAIKINVVRQTVSKWEKGLSVPDADILGRIAEVLEVEVSELLGTPVKHKDDDDEIAIQLAKISEQLAIKNRRSKRIWKIIGIVLIAGLVFNLLLVVLGVGAFGVNVNSKTTYIEEESIEEVDE